MNCPLCKNQAEGFDVWVPTEEGNIFKCKTCGLGFLDPECIKNLSKLNSELYNAQSYYNLLFKQYHDLNARYKKQLKEIRKIFKKDGKLLDYGCSIGMFLNNTRLFGFKPYGYDINRINLLKAEKKFAINILPENFLYDSKYDNFFDIITMWDVLEHIEDPINILSRLNLKLKPNGLLVVQCPNMDSYEFLKLGKEWNWLTPGDHLLFFTINTLSKVLLAGGFLPFKVKCWSNGGIFSSVNYHIYNKDITLIINRKLHVFSTIFNIYLRRFSINFPFDKIIRLYGKFLQLIHCRKRNLSLIKIFSWKVDSKRKK